jgi:hypothetical protein
MDWKACQLVCSSCGGGAAVSAGMRKSLVSQLDHFDLSSNVRLNQHDLSCWQGMIQDVLMQHGIRPMTIVNKL